VAYNGEFGVGEFGVEFGVRVTTNALGQFDRKGDRSGLQVIA
jgi:hypothetical protein